MTSLDNFRSPPIIVQYFSTTKPFHPKVDYSLHYNRRTSLMDDTWREFSFLEKFRSRRNSWLEWRFIHAILRNFKIQRFCNEFLRLQQLIRLSRWVTPKINNFRRNKHRGSPICPMYMSDVNVGFLVRINDTVKDVSWLEDKNSSVWRIKSEFHCDLQSVKPFRWMRRRNFESNYQFTLPEWSNDECQLCSVQNVIYSR